MSFVLTEHDTLVRRAAVHFEKGDYDKCIADCDAAVERGRELRADYKTIARALTRKGNSLVKQGKLGDAIDTFQKALTEHRCSGSSYPVADDHARLQKLKPSSDGRSQWRITQRLPGNEMARDHSANQEQ